MITARSASLWLAMALGACGRTGVGRSLADAPEFPAPTFCATASADDGGCKRSELCGATGHGNGLDDDCDGLVDEDCPCTPGDVERCFVGPPAKHDIGACTDGTQTCVGGGSWGDCRGGISPSPELCDGLDNDCDGCTDDAVGCNVSELQCPTSGSLPDEQPFTNVTYDGNAHVGGGAQSWSWTVTGGPCDRLFSATGKQSFSLSGEDSATPSVRFTLSGDYTVTMKARDARGAYLSCTWVQHVVGPGVRVELCWDTTGSSDLDLHVHRPGVQSDFFSPSDDCYYRNCSRDPQDPNPDWGYSWSSSADCPSNFCANPRLDIDNIKIVGVPENVNIDRPRAGDSFRTMIHYYGTTDRLPLESHPLVNIYCGGRLKATYGQPPDLVDFMTPLNAGHLGDTWRVADIAPIVDGSGATVDCNVTALHPSGSTEGYRVSHEGNRSYEGE